MNKTKKIIIIVAIVITILALLGGTYAYWKWQLAAANRTTITLTYADGFSCTADGGGDITSSNVELIPASCTNSTYAIKRTVTVTPTLAGVDQLSLNLQLKIDNISQALSNSDNFRYALTKDNSSCTNNVFAEGTFKGKQNGDTVDLLTNKNYLSSQPDTYYLYIWLDSAETDIATMDQPFRFFLTGDCTNQPFDRYTVTFDANGGTVNVPSKEVAYGSKYGSLPTPTREGYTFKGWHGKNLLNYNVISSSMQGQGILVDDNGYISDSTPTGDTRGWAYSYNNGWRSYLNSGTYTVSLIFSTQSTNGDNRIVIQNESGTTFVNAIFANKSSISSTFTLTNSETINIVAKGYNGIFRIQIEEGSEATEWEPYYITSDTTVVQEKNHTLTAIWEPETYTVTFDANGGTVGVSSMEVTYGDVYNNLPTPTRSGYSFNGWHGKNLFNMDATPYASGKYITAAGDFTSLSDYSVYKVNIFGNRTYTITNSGQSQAPGYVIYDSSDTKLAGAGYGNKATVSFTTPTNASYVLFSVVAKSSSYRYDKEIFQLEEGSEATVYEPYYVTNDVTVTQAKDHTLTAIWQKN